MAHDVDVSATTILVGFFIEVSGNAIPCGEERWEDTDVGGELCGYNIPNKTTCHFCCSQDFFVKWRLACRGQGMINGVITCGVNFDRHLTQQTLLAPQFHTMCVCVCVCVDCHFMKMFIL